MADPSASQDDLARAVDLQRRGRLTEAIEIYRRVVGAEPRHAAAFNLLALASFQHGQVEEAIAAMNSALALQPSLPDGRFNLGLMLQARGRIAEAAEQYRMAIADKPNDYDACVKLGAALNAMEQFAEALPHFESALKLAPDDIEAHHNTGIALLGLQRPADAIPHYEKVVALRPDVASAWMNLGNAHYELGRYAKAGPCYEKALAIRPTGEAHMNFARCLQALGHNGDALVHFDGAIALKPDWPAAKFNKAMLCLALRHFAEGWELYEQRWAAVPANKPRLYAAPLWDGRRVGRLVMWGEQGLGDQILHSSMITEAAAHADHVVLEVEPRLCALYARSFPSIEVVALSDTLFDGAMDAHIPLGSLGRMFRPDAAAFPRRERGYLLADAARAGELRQRLHPAGAPVIGLSWISHNPRSGKSKSARLADLEALLRLPHCRFVDLQYGDTSAERDEVERELGVRVERLADIDNTHDIDGLAALIAACDAVVSVSNTTAHLAGALGASTWTLVPHGHARIWYWFKDCDDSPWYPNVRVRRQAMGQGWREAFAAVAPEVAGQLGASLT